MDYIFFGNWGYVKKVWLIYKIDDDIIVKIIINIFYKSGDIYVEKVLIDELNERKEKVKKINNFFGSEFDVFYLFF